MAERRPTPAFPKVWADGAGVGCAAHGEQLGGRNVETTPDVGHDADEELHHPRGTLLIMGLYLLSMVAAWAWIFFVLEGRT